jgi:uncharacterized protein (DUF885 family)
LSDSIRQLADDYWKALLDVEPTWRHMLGDYSDVGSYEHCSRVSDDSVVATLRDFASRAEAHDEGPLDEQERLTRGVLASSATSTADLLEARLTELAADPVHGPQTTLALVLGMLAVPDEQVADAMPAKLDGIGTFFHELAERVHEGVGRGWVRAEFAVSETIAQIEAALAVAPASDPMLGAVAVPDGVDADAFRARLQEAIERSVRPGMEAYRDALRDHALPIAKSEEQ